MMSFVDWKEKFLLEGLMPERALLRLRRAGISVYDAKKIEKNRILFCVKKKDSEKVFAIYPNVCYNKSVCSAYTVKKLTPLGVGRWANFFKRRVGLLLGGLFCMIAALATQPYVFTVECIGAVAYRREALMALAEVGIKPFSRYRQGFEDVVCAKLLAIDDVAFCSVKKVGYRIVVEMQTSPFAEKQAQKGEMRAKRTGEIVALTVLRGSPLKKIGDKVKEGEILVEPYFYTEQGGKVRVEIIARVRMLCAWQADVEAKDKEEAFAKAYLALALTDEDAIEKIEITENGTLYNVRVDYTAVEQMNF